MIHEPSPVEETNGLLRAMILLLVMGPPPEEQRAAFLVLASVGIHLNGAEPESEPERPESRIVQFPDRSPRTPEAG